MLVVARVAGRLRDVPFAPSYWAFTFPLTALAIAALRQGIAAPQSIAGALALPLFVVANAVVAAVAWQTGLALSRAMTYKAAYAGLPLGGAKAVIEEELLVGPSEEDAADE